jgi:hypothetical protein
VEDAFVDEHVVDVLVDDHEVDVAAADGGAACGGGTRG